MGKNFWDILRVPYKTDKKSTCIVCLAFAVTSIMPILLVTFITNFIDGTLDYFNDLGDLYSVFLNFVGIIMTMFATNYCIYISKKQSKVLECSLEEELTQKYAKKKSKLKYELIEDEKVLDLLLRVDAKSVSNWSVNLNSFLSLLLVIFRGIFIFAIIFAINKILATILLIIAMLYVKSSIKTGNSEYEIVREMTNVQRKAKHFEKVLTSRENAKEREIFQFGDFARDKFDDSWKSVLGLEKQMITKRNTKFGAVNASSALFLGVIMLIFLPSVENNTLSVGLYISLMNQINVFMDQVAWNVSRNILGLTKFKHYIKDVGMLFALEENTEINSNNQIEDVQKIEFKNVTFAYPNSKTNVLENFSLVLTSDKSYGLVGKNGCGKTTLTKLLMGLYTNYTGEILINGVNIKEIGNVFDIFSVVFQDFVKYELTIGEFLELGGSKIDVEILKQIEIYDFIESLPQKFDTKLGHLFEGGVDLSGGQWQRLAIARTLSKQAEIYVLDEPSSALDPLVELAMYEMFYKSLDNKFSIFITHRLGIAKLLDEIVVIDNGKVCEKDTHENLLLQNGIYATMYNTQKEWYDEEIR